MAGGALVDPLANKTIRAVTVLSVLCFAAGTIVWLLAWGQPANSLHASALSWSYSLAGFCLVALLGEAALATYFQKPGQ
jgi:hypothetical protein